MNLFPIEKGISIGWGFESWEKSSSADKSEMSDFIANIEIFSIFSLKKRIILIPLIGASSALSNMFGAATIQDDFISLYSGLKFGWLIHPAYKPFIGPSLYLKYFSRFVDKKKQYAVVLNFSAGSKIWKFKDSSFWIFFDFGLFSSEHEKYAMSYFNTSFAYQF